MAIVGIDLAGLDKNETGICIYEGKNAITRIAHTDNEIAAAIDQAAPALICIDAPLTMPAAGATRQCDRDLLDYGALPPLLGGMRPLTERGNALRKQLQPRYKVVEVLVRASAKILGLYDVEPLKVQKALMALGITGDLQKRKLTKDELDSIIAAITGQLYLDGKTREAGGEDGKIVVPVV